MRRAGAASEGKRSADKAIVIDSAAKATLSTRVFDAAKAKMVGAGIDFAFAAGAEDVARTIFATAKEGAAAVDALVFVRFRRIER